MALRDIITIPDPILREVSRPVERIDAPLLALLDDMLETMYEAPGIGLAGIQIACPLRIITVDCAEREEEEEGDTPAEAEDGGEEGEGEKERVRDPIFLINPRIVKLDDAVSTYEEGCLSIPEYFAEVERPASCVVEYLDREGNKQTLEATGLLSTCIQHEIDHLDGKLFIDHISKLKRDMVVKKFTKLARQSGKQNAAPLVI